MTRQVTAPDACGTVHLSTSTRHYRLPSRAIYAIGLHGSTLFPGGGSIGRVHSNWHACRIIAGRERRLWYMKHGYLQTQYINRCGYVGTKRFGRHRWKQFFRPHPAHRGISQFENVGFSRSQGNPKVWSATWSRPRKKPRQRLIRRTA